MPDDTPQTLANHTRFDPPFHFFAVPVLGITVLVMIWMVIREFSFLHLWLVVVFIALVTVALKARIYALKAQDRVIRLEERLRLSTLLPEPLRARIPELTESQLVALRFASDAEIPGLVEKTLAGKMSNAEIKKAIVNWRPDTFRV
jgi:Family of unknown function (DUF6526)